MRRRPGQRGIRSCDLFCRVVDNLGDAGVCWRLARRLARDRGLSVRLWIDRPETLLRFVLADAADRALLDDGRIRVLPWPSDASFPPPADLVIETFGCDLPEACAVQVAARAPAVAWYNLEYLSAEDWVDGCHALPSPHPRLGVSRIFFFPGFTAATGGLLREPGLLEARAAWERAQAGEASGTGAPVVPGDAAPLAVGLFCYAGAPVAALLDGLSRHPGAVTLRVFQGPAQQAADDWSRAHAGHDVRIELLPWMGQDDFDRVLWSCDFNIVRGEDSFVRAQWAGRPLLWDIYPQPDGAHLVKMAAFLRRYRESLAAPAAAAVGALWQAWVRREEPAVAPAWAELATCLPVLRQHADHWCAGLATRPDLADALLAHAGRSRSPAR